MIAIKAIPLMSLDLTPDTLTPAIVNEFIERINVHAPDKSSGHRSQQIDIIYNFIGILPIPQAKEEAA